MSEAIKDLKRCKILRLSADAAHGLLAGALDLPPGREVVATFIHGNGDLSVKIRDPHWPATPECGEHPACTLEEAQAPSPPPPPPPPQPALTPMPPALLRWVHGRGWVYTSNLNVYPGEMVRSPDAQTIYVVVVSQSGTPALALAEVK